MMVVATEIYWRNFSNAPTAALRRTPFFSSSSARLFLSITDGRRVNDFGVNCCVEKVRFNPASGLPTL